MAAPDGIGEERLLSAVMLFDLGAQPGNAFLEGFLQGAAQALRSLGELRPLVVEQIEPRFLRGWGRNLGDQAETPIEAFA